MVSMSKIGKNLIGSKIVFKILIYEDMKGGLFNDELTNAKYTTKK